MRPRRSICIPTLSALILPSPYHISSLGGELSHLKAAGRSKTYTNDRFDGHGFFNGVFREFGVEIVPSARGFASAIVVTKVGAFGNE